MRDTDRRCTKCNRSTAQDPSLKLYRFPKPGPFNIERCRQWARFCYPDKDWQSQDFQKSLFSKHKMLCHLHFKECDFIDFASKKLNRYAAPSDNDMHTGSSIQPAAVESGTAVVAGSSNFPGSTVQPAPMAFGTEIIAAQTTATVSTNFPGSTVQPAPMAFATEIIAAQTTATVSTNRTAVAGRAAATVATSAGVSRSTSTVQQKLVTNREKRLYNKCRRNLTTICKLKKQLKNLKKDALLETLCSNDAVQQLSENLSSPFAVLLQGQIFNIKRKPKGRRWNLKQKLIALQIYKRSPSCYRLLRRLFSLPSQSTLKNLLNQIPLNPGINSQIFDTIRNITKTESQERNECILMYDEMSIRKHLQYDKKNDVIMGYQDHGDQGRDAQIASYALVFMVAGVRKKFKQPVAYYLSGASVTADRLTVLIKEVLDQCFAAGLNVAATVCDMATTNTKALHNLGATKDHPYFMHKEHEIVALYDTPHLLKCFRNLFLKYNIKCNLGPRCEAEGSKRSNPNQQGVAKWDHIKQFYQIDNMNPNFVFAPALTVDHLDPNSKQKMKVNLAAQVLSFTVSAGMYSRMAQGELPAEAVTTINLIKKIDCLFDSLNADSPDLRRGKQYSTNLSDTHNHIQFWNNEIIPLFENIEFIGAKHRPPSLDGWIQTIKGVERLWTNLKKKYPYTIKSLATRRLQQDPLENCFGCIRGYCGSNTNPNAIQFIAALKSSIINNLHKISKKTNCEEDNTEVLTNLNIFLNKSNNQSQSSNSPDNDILTQNVYLLDDDCPEDMISELQACAYISGFIVKRIQKDIKCDECENMLLTEQISPYHTFISFKEYSEKKTKLRYPTDTLTECVEELAKTTNKFLKDRGHETDIKKKICSILQSHEKLAFIGNCTTHQEKIKESIALSIFYICIKRFCFLTNQTINNEYKKSQLSNKIKILKHK